MPHGNWQEWLRKQEKEDSETLTAPAGIQRPTTRGDCMVGGHNQQRPCPFVSCRHHLYIEVDELKKSLRFTDPALDLDEFEETCSLDVADRGGATLEEVGALLNVTRERTRQIEVKGLTILRNSGDMEDAPYRDSNQDHW